MFRRSVPTRQLLAGPPHGLEIGEPTFQRSDLLSQSRKRLKGRRRLAPRAVVDGWQARDERPGRHRVGNPALPRGPRPLPDSDVTVDSDLAGEHDRVFDGGAPGDPNLGGEQYVPPDTNAVSNLDEVIDLRSRADPGFSDGGSIDGHVRANLDIRLEYDPPQLWDLLVRPVRSLSEPIAVASDHGSVLQHDPVTDVNPLPNRHMRMEDAVGPNECSRSDVHTGMDDRARTHRCAGPDGHKRPNRHTVSQGDVRGETAGRIYTGTRLDHVAEQPDRTRESEVGRRGTQHRARCRVCIIRQNNRRCLSRTQCVRVSRIGKEGEVAGLRDINAGYPVDIDITVAVEPTSQTLGHFAELQIGEL